MPKVEDDLSEVRRILQTGLAGLNVEIFLFGSRATGRARPCSDIDVAVLPSTPLPVGLLARIREELEGSRVPYVVDLVDLSVASEGFRSRVRREGIQWAA